MRCALAIVGTVVVAGCPSPQQPRARDTDDRALRVQVAQLEARRGAGVGELVALAERGELPARVLALRALGRVGGDRAGASLRRALGDGDPQLVTAAVAALGVAGALDDDAATARPWLGAALLAALPRAGDRAVALAALGRAGDATAQPTIAGELAAAAPIAEAAAIALGRFGRRKLALAADTRAALVAATRRPEAAVRYAATYALAREHAPPADPAAAAALAARVGDDDAETRATAIAGLVRRDAIATARRAIEDSLRDRDWRVAVEAVRALAGEHGDDAGRDAVAAVLVRRFAELERGDRREAHVVLEGLRALAPHGGRPLVAGALDAVYAAARDSTKLDPLARAWIDCLAMLGMVRAMRAPDVDAIVSCGRGQLPAHLRLPLLAELPGSRGAIRAMVEHRDPRVRAAGVAALAKSYRDGDDADRRNIVATLAAALASPELVLAGAAVDAAPAVYEHLAGPADRAALDTAVVARAARERDVELAAALYELVGKQQIVAGADACRAGVGGEPVRARAAIACLLALGEAATPVVEPGAATPPPVDLAAVIGTHPRWHLATSRGEVVIELAPEVAPWAVATIVALARRGFYDGVEFHRVVPDFVVQGGDPTATGAGGPGFTIPAEPSAGDGFVAGGVGIADAGRDSGGSQYFAMHARSPHLDARYTWIGRVVAGQAVADALLVGDRVLRATIELR